MTRPLPCYLKSRALVVFLITYCNVNAQWVERNNGLWGGQINTLLADGNNLFAGTAGGGIYFSTDKGENWVRRSDDNVVGYQVSSIWKKGKNLYSSSSGLCLSTDDGVTWQTLTYAFGKPNAIVSNDQDIFVGTQNGLFVSTDQGSNWASVRDNELKTANVYSLAINESCIFAGTGSGMFASSDNGMNWQPINNGLNTTPSGPPVTSIVIRGTNIFAGTSGDGVYISTNSGLSWNQINNGLSVGTYINVTSLQINGTNLYATLADGVFLSTNDGASWSKLKGSPSYSSTLAVIGSSLFVGTEDNGVVLTNDIGTSWKSVNNGLGFTQILSINSNGSNLFAGTSRGIFRSQDNGNNWTLTSSLFALRNVESFAIDDSNIFAGTQNNGVFRSTDNGVNWVSVNTGLTNLFVRALIFKEKTLFAATLGGGVFRSINNGATWTAVNNGLTDTAVLSFEIVGNSLFIGTFGGVFVSSDNGISWQPINNGLVSKDVLSLTSIGNKLFAGTSGGGVFQTIDNGNNWTPVDIVSSNKFVSVLFADGKIIYAGLTSDAFLSYDQGANWMAISDKEFESIHVKNGYLFAGLVGRGIWSRPLTDFKFEQTITFNTLASKTFGDASFVLSASASSSLPITYSSSDPTVVSISGNIGIILKAGTVTITASQEGDDTFNPAPEIQQTLTISKATPSITWSNPADIVYGTTLSATQLNATSSIVGTFTYTPAINTKLNAGSAQQLSVTLSPTDDINYLTTTAKVSINVSKAQQQITFGALPDKTIGDGPFTLTATVNSTLPVSYSTTSDKVGIASGIVSLLKPGRVDITANQSGNENYNAAASVSQSFCIKPIKPIITLSGLNTATPTLTSSASTGNQWYSGTTLLTGENNNTLVIKTSGTYKVQVKADDCLSEFSLDQNLIITGDIPTTSDPLLVYPNPATSILTIDLGNEDGKKEVAIFDLLGRSIFSQHTEGKKTEIDVSEYTRGLYIIKVQTTLGKSILRFEKQ
jgi:photosystem II stability/assembly factor-like uncharacterized protein